MIKLNLCIYEGDCDIITFKERDDLLEYIFELNNFDCIWLVSIDDEILVTESLGVLILFTEVANMNSEHDENNFTIHLHEYQSYEDAYAVALSMKEVNPKCYN